jgi:hypothetical protein
LIEGSDIMRKVAVLFALAVFVTVAPAHGRNFWRGDTGDRDGVGSFWNADNWEDGFVPGSEGHEGVLVEIRHGGTATIDDPAEQNATDTLSTGWWQVGYLWDGSDFGCTGLGPVQP